MRPEVVKAGGIITAQGPVSAHSQLLPFLEQVTLFNAINLNPGPPLSQSIASCPANATAATIRLAVFICPADGGSMEPGNNYRACNGSQPHEFEGLTTPGGGGAFPGFKYTTPRDFTDGLSNTAGFSERSVGGAVDTRPDWSRDLWFSGLNSVTPVPGRSLLLKTCGSPTQAGMEIWSKMGRTWIAASYADTLYNHVAPPNWSGIDCSDSLALSDPTLFSGGIISARSRHSSGVNLLMMDGGVRSIRSTIDLAIWRAHGTRSGGDVAVNAGL